MSAFKLFSKSAHSEEQFVSKKAEERSNFLRKFSNLVNNASQIVIFPHVNPDGDCLGGAFGLQRVFKNKFPEKKVYVVGESKGVFPWLEMNFEELPLDFDYASSLAMIIDTGVSDRIQRFQDYFGNPETQKWGAVVRVDHHELHQDFQTDLVWVDASYATCCAQLVQICDYYRWELTSKSATYFLLGILTDSGFFGNAEVTPRTLVLAAKALRAGADREFLINNLRTTHALEARFRGFILSNFNQEDKLAWIFVEKKVVDEFKPFSLTSNQVASLAHIEGNVMWMLFSEVEEGEIRVSFRSVGTLDVRKIAEEFGGGGHLNAAGTTLSNKEQVEAVVSRAREMVEEFSASKGETSKDVLVEKAKDKFDDTINPAYRQELSPEEERTLADNKLLLEKTKQTFQIQAKLKKEEDLVNADEGFKTFLEDPEEDALAGSEDDIRKEIESIDINDAVEESIRDVTEEKEKKS